MNRKKHTTEVLSELSELQLKVNKAENDFKSYYLTKDYGYLERYQQNKSLNFDNMFLLVSDNITQTNSLSKLKSDLEKKAEHYNKGKGSITDNKKYSSDDSYINAEFLNQEIDNGFTAIRDEETSLLAVRTKKI